MIKAEFVIVADLRPYLSNLKRRTKNNIVRKAIRYVMRFMRDDLRERLPKDTQALVKSLAPRVSIHNDIVTGRVAPRSGYKRKGQEPIRYVAAVERGRKESAIKRKQVLSDGSKFYGKKVKAVSGKHIFQQLQQGKESTYVSMLKAKTEQLLTEATK